jgi:hypothetical protein
VKDEIAADGALRIQQREPVRHVGPFCEAIAVAIQVEPVEPDRRVGAQEAIGTRDVAAREHFAKRAQHARIIAAAAPLEPLEAFVGRDLIEQRVVQVAPAGHVCEGQVKS